MPEKDVGNEEQVALRRVDSEADEASQESQGSGRRGFLKGAAAGSILFSISGRPAWGSACTPSALASANASGQHDYDTCASKSAGYWKVTSRWPAGISPDQKFHGFFPGDRFGDLTLGQVINLTGGRTSTVQPPGEEGYELSDGPYFNEANIGFHAVGALVNAHAFPVGDDYGDFGYTPRQITMIYGSGDTATVAAFFECINNQFDEDYPFSPICAPPEGTI